MLPFRKILFPIDYSEPCRAVVPYVNGMSRHFSASITLVHACGLGVEALQYSELTTADPRWQAEWRAFEERRIRDFAVEMFPGEHVECFSEEGDAPTLVHKVVQHQGTDLVMLPTHGIGPVRRFLLGSVTAKLLHDLTTVVWTGANSTLAERSAVRPYKSIVCALDDTEEAEAILRAAVTFADSYKAELSLLHVVETPPTAWDVDFMPYTKALMASADHWLWELKRTLGLDVPHSVIASSVSEGVRQAAIQGKADLVIVGRGHAQGTLATMWSRLYSIVREAPCPILSI